MRLILTIQRLFRTYRPGIYFSIIAALLMLLSLVFLIPVLIDYSRTGLVERFPTLIVCGFVAIAALQSFFSGQILKTIYQKNRQDFEMDLYRVTSEQQKKQENA